jgi:hypothetical protein
LELRRRCQERVEIGARVYVPNAPLGEFMTEYVARRKLMMRILGLHGQRESSHSKQPITALRPRSSLPRPVDNGLRSNELVVACVSERRESSQEPVLRMELEPHGAMKFDVTDDGGG